MRRFPRDRAAAWVWGRKGNVEKQNNGHFDSGWDSHCSCLFFPAGMGVAEGGDKKKGKKSAAVKRRLPHIWRGNHRECGDTGSGCQIPGI